MNKFYTLLTLLFFISSVNAQTVERGPYLQSGGSNSIIVKWRTNYETTSKVWIGDQPGSLNIIFDNDANSVEDHEVLVDNLSPNTKYYYAVGHDEDVLAGGDSKHFFTTAPTVGTAHPIRAWVLGDCGTGGSGASAVRDAFYEYNDDIDIDMILLLGDNAYSDGTDDDYQGALFEKYYKMIRATSMWSCMGNHDYRSANIDNESGPYFDIFTFPENGELGGVPSGSEAYYSFDYANVHFITLDSEASEKNPGDPMLIWLENDLNATNQDWIIVMFHHPPYSKGSHDSDEGGSLIKMRENVLPILDAGGVDLVLSGHSHSYERSYLLNGHYGESDELEPEMILDDGDGKTSGSGAYQKTTVGSDANKGAVYVVSGSAAKMSSGDLNHPVMYYSKKELGSVLLELDGDQLNLEFINDDGEIADNFTMIKTGLSEGDPPAITIVNPLEGQTFLQNELISIAANADDLDGSVTKVEFFIDNNYLLTDYSEPYTINWTTAQTGIYSLSAKATDNEGNVTASIPINIEVIEDNTGETGISTANCPGNSTWPCENGNGTNVSWMAPIFESDCDSGPGILDCNPISIIGTSYLGIFEGSHYYQTDGSVKWAAAQSLAEANGGYLAVIESAAENDFIQNAISNNSWIGYSDETTEGDFQWVNGGTSSYENWANYQPSGSSDSSDDYTLFSASDGTWNDKANYKYRAILELPCTSTGGGGNGLQISQTSGFVNGAVFPEGTTTVSYQASDACGNMSTCSFNVTIAACSTPVCSITATVGNIQCNDSGTPDDGSDDTYTFDLAVQGSNTGSGWTANGGSGAYGQAETQGPFNGVGGNSITWNITDIGNADCSTSVSFVIPTCTSGPNPELCVATEIAGFTWMATTDESIYYLSDGKENWGDAKEICETAGGHLVHINSADENDLLLGLLAGINNFVLIGVSDHLEEGTLVWADGTALTYDNFEGNPGDSDDDFGLMNSWTGSWDFVNQYVAKRFFLEIPCGNGIQGMQNMSIIAEAAPVNLELGLRESNVIDYSTETRLFPNPVKDKLNLHFVAEKDIAKVLLKIISSDNKLVLSQTQSIQKGLNTLEVSTAKLNPGAYFVQIVLDDEVLVERFVKL